MERDFGLPPFGRANRVDVRCYISISGTIVVAPEGPQAATPNISHGWVESIVQVSGPAVFFHGWGAAWQYRKTVYTGLYELVLVSSVENYLGIRALDMRKQSVVGAW